MSDHDERRSTPAPSAERLTTLARARLGEMSDVQDARLLHGVMAGFARASVRRRRARRPLLLAGATVSLAALVLGGLLLLRRPPLTYAMVGGQLQAGYFQSAHGSRSTVQFSDGTRLDLVAGARGRIAAVDPRGARVLLDEGEARARVVRRDDARWRFEAGPFVVDVQGTDFTLSWRGDEGRLDVRLDEGAVSVTGPLSSDAIVLHPGQWLTVRLAAREVFVRDFDRAAPPALSAPAAPPPVEAVPAPLADPSPAPAPDEPPTPAASRPARPAPRPAAREPSWARARAAGDWQGVLDSATRRGLERTLAERGSDDLALLADAAHYLQRDDVAAQALTAQRRRFAGSTRAKDAAFLLGRIAEARPGGAAQALAWYDRHLEEAPGGAYASEALGRKMIVLATLRGEAAARPVAEEYLRRYPGGTYARAARAYAGRP